MRKWTILFLLIATIVGLFFWMQFEKKPALDLNRLEATVLEPARALPSFTMEDMNGKPFDNSHLKGKWHFLFFGFTQCSAICPTSLATVNQAFLVLAKQKKVMPDLLFITIDPLRDSAKQLQSYLHAYNPAFLGLRATNLAELNQLTQSLGIVYEKEVTKGGELNFNHTGVLVLVDPHGQVRAFFSPPLSAETLSHEYSLIVEHFE